MGRVTRLKEELVELRSRISRLEFMAQRAQEDAHGSQRCSLCSKRDFQDNLRQRTPLSFEHKECQQAWAGKVAIPVVECP